MKKEEPINTLPALIANGKSFAVSTRSIDLPEELAAEITDADFDGYEDDGQSFPIVTIRQQDEKDEKGKTLHPAGGFRMYDPVAVSNNVAVADVPAEPGLVLTILADQSSRVYFPNMGEPVACRSNDGILGVGNPGGNCAACPLNKLSPMYSGNPVTCKAQKNLLAYDHVSHQAFVLRLNPSGLTIWKNFKAAVMKRQKIKLPLSAVAVGVTTKYVSDDKGKYYQPVFSPIGALPVETYRELRAIKDAAKPAMEKAVAIVTEDESPSIPPPNTYDRGGELPPGVEPVRGGVIPGHQQVANAKEEDLPF